ncbi:MAG: YegS/Rv2252/BmrU family lipid kinase [Propioniciclava sp.]|uniref:diacylglycerol/lipid kinase family protein n=1 Tax=Propioniciclava sp. TaxID=2038686 RepID=UPI0039E3D44E
MKRLALVVNPSAGRGRGDRMTALIEYRLAAAGYALATTRASSVEHARVACADAVAGGVDGLVVVGGDGMAHLGVNACANTGVPLGIVPAGTGNDFCRGVGIGRRWSGGVDAVVRGRVRTIDLAEVTGGLYSGERVYVGCVVSTGFDERVNARANNFSVDLGAPAYAWAVVREVGAFNPLRYRLTVNGRTRELDAMLVAVANSGIFGGGIKIAPDYDLTDGLLDVVIVHPLSKVKLAALFPRLMIDPHFTHPVLERFRVSSITVAGDDLHGAADGEPLGIPPLTVSAAPGALRVFAPGL